jgi:hypothetical protein
MSKFKYHFLFLIFLIISSELFARAGGGGGGGLGIGYRANYGSSNQSFSYDNMFQTVFWGFLSLVLFIGGYFIFSKYADKKINNHKDQVKNILIKMSVLEPEWSEENLINFSKSQFLKIQDLWGSHNLAELDKHLSDLVLDDWKYKIQDQQSKNEKNILAEIVFKDVFIVNAQNYKDDNLDTFTVCFEVSAVDQTLVNNISQSSTISHFREFWTFQRQNQRWILIDVDQATGWRRFVNAHLVYERIGLNNP